MNKNWEGQIDTKAVGFIEDTEDTENHEICPIMSSQDSPVHCREDCAWFSNVCLIAGIEKTRIEECVIKTISRAICDIPTWR